MDNSSKIAIVGVGCKFPGADDLDEFWRVLVNGEDHVKDIPLERFDMDSVYDPNPDVSGKAYVKKAGLLSNIDQWDNRFFGINDTEAENMDPQQHLVLESVHMALEDGGITRHRLTGSDTGVYIGVMNDDFKSQMEAENVRNYTVTGVNSSIISARVSYFYDLRGPSLVIDTACSSSLVAIHTACQAIKAGDISMAICGGVSAIADPYVFVILSKARMASPTGKCHTFSKNADGYARGEGCGIVILKSLEKALRDRNKIWGTIITGCNQDGHTNMPITAPSQSQQVKLLQKVYRENQIDVDLIQYIEAHGTGTQVGDPIETNALGTFFNRQNNNEKITIGSVKTNIGHLESGAGVAGLIKVLLMMKMGKFVPSLHSETLNPNIPFDKYNIEVSRTIKDWLIGKSGLRYACVNSFGFGGTNSHAIVVSHNSLSKENQDSSECEDSYFYQRYPVIFSAEEPSSLFKSIKNVKDNLQSVMSLEDLSYTTVFRRDHFKYRKFICADTKLDLENKMNNILTSENDADLPPSKNRNVTFVFCGVGTVWKGMCKALLAASPAFQEAILEIDQHLRVFSPSLSVHQMFQNEEDVAKNPLKNHIAIFACQVGLVSLWKHMGIFPSAVVGQSVGEVAAAFTSGALTIEQAVKVIYFRSLHLSKCKSGNMMVVQNCPTKEVLRLCNNIKTGYANIAVFSSNTSCILSGDRQTIEEMKQRLPKGATFFPLNVSCAYHSRYTVQASEMLKKSLEGLEPLPNQLRVYSTVTGRMVEREDAFASASYWAANVSNPVHFSKAISISKETQKNVLFLEIGPRPVLNFHLQNIFESSHEVALPSITKEMEIEVIKKTMSQLFELGENLNWRNIVPLRGYITALPKYIFTKSKGDLNTKSRLPISKQNPSPKEFSMLVKSTEQKNMFIVPISRSETSFIFDHKVEGIVIVPGALYGEVAIEIAGFYFAENPEELDISWTILSPFQINDGVKNSLSVQVYETSQTKIDLEIFANKDSKQVATVSIQHTGPKTQNILDTEKIERVLRNKGYSTDLYSGFRQVGLNLGSTFQTVTKHVIEDNETFTEIILPHIILKNHKKLCFHPVIIDSMFQSCITVTPELSQRRNTRIFPTHIACMRIFQNPSKRMMCYARRIKLLDTKLTFNVILMKGNGLIVAEMKGVEISVVSGDVSMQSLSYEETWSHIDLPENSSTTARPMMILSWNKRYLEKILSNDFKPIECVYLQTIGDKIEDMIETSRHKKDLVFIPGKFAINDRMNGETVLQSVLETTGIFVKILKAMKTSETCVFVITEATQGQPLHQSRVFGAELWGLTRSILMEGTKLDITLIDVHGDTENYLQNLMHLISTVRADYHREHPREFIVNAENIMERKIKQMSGHFFSETTRNDRYDKGVDVLFRSESFSSEIRLFAIPAVRPITMNSELVKILTTSAVLCTQQNHFRREFNTSSLEHLWPEYIEDGFDVLACEINGACDIAGQNIEVVACSIVPLGTSVHVNKHCICPRKDIPHYSVGLLFSTVVALSLGDAVPRKKKVFIVHDDDTKNVARILENVLFEKQVEIEKCQNGGDIKLQLYASSHLVILTKKVLPEIEDMIKLFQNLARIISLESIFSRSRASSFSNRSFEIFLFEMEDLFKTKRLSEMFPLIIKTARKNALNYDKDLSNKESRVLDIYQHLPNMCLRITKKLTIRSDSTYVVVGGLSGLGWFIVKYLAECGAKSVITLSRRDPTESKKECITNIKKLRGVDVIHYRVDICNFEDLQKMLSNVFKQYPNIVIKGVFQGAGVLRDRSIDKITDEDFKEVFRPKVLGSWNLHLLFKKFDLDYFVMHSSIASAVGNDYQTNYAAGNSFIDSLAHYRCSQGKKAQVINWGALEIGMGEDKFIQDIFLAKGIKPLTKNQILTALSQVLLLQKTQTMFANVDSKVFNSSKRSENTTKVSSTLKQEQVPKTILVENNYSMNDKNDFKNNDEQVSVLTSIVRSLCADVLALEVFQIEETSTLAEFGLDSQNAVELANLLYSKTHIRLPVVFLLSGERTVSDIVNELQETFNTVNTENLDEEENSITDSPSPYEQHFLDMQKENPLNPELVISMEYQVSGSANNTELHLRVLKNLVMLNPELRTLYIPTDTKERHGSIVKKILDPEDAILRYKTVTTETEYQTSFKQMFHFDHSVDIPLRAIFWTDTRNMQLHVRLLLSHCSIDNGCTLSISNDLKFIIKSFYLQQKISTMSIRKPLDTASIVQEIFRPQMNVLRQYWAEQLNKCEIKELTLRNSKEAFWDDIVENDNCLTTLRIDSTLFDGIEQFAQKNKITVFTIICTAYQIVLHRHTKAKRVCLISSVDNRNHFPEFRERIAVCVNYIPLISPDFSLPEMNFRNALSQMFSTVTEAMSKSVFPFIMMKELKEFKKTTHALHRISMGDQKYLDSFDDTNKDFHIKQVETLPDSRYETGINIYYSRKNRILELRLLYCPKNVGRYLADTLLENIHSLLKLFLVSLDASPCSLDCRPVIETTVRNEKFEVRIGGRNGYTKRTTLRVYRNDQDVKIQWGKKYKHVVTLKEISTISPVSRHGLHGIKIGSKKETTFFTQNRRLRDALMIHLQNYGCDVEGQHTYF